MYFASYVLGSQENVGVLNVENQEIIPIENIFPQSPPLSMQEFIEKFSEAIWEDIQKGVVVKNGIPLSQIKLSAPIPKPIRGIICLGKNYQEHVKEMASAVNQTAEVPDYPVYFSKMVDRALGDNDLIPNHIEVTKELDYEVELAVVIGKEGNNIPKEKAEEYIFGYTILNDITARNLQKQHSQWFKGKSLDGTCPMGPYLVHKCAIKFPPDLSIQSFVNGELRQNSKTSDLIYSIAHIISDLSRGITLKPGDVISTGTPSGVGMGFKPSKFLKPGDEIICYIEKIGRLTNKVTGL